MTTPPRKPTAADQTRAGQLVEAGVAAHRLNAFSDAERDYRAALALVPDTFDARHLLGFLLVQTGRAEEGEALLTLAARGRPRDAAVQMRLGLARASLRRPQEALACYARALTLDANLAEAWFHRAQALRDVGRDEDALASLREALKVTPTLAEAWLNSGNILTDMGRLDEAVAAYDKAITSNPSLAAAWFNRGNALRALGRLEEAVTNFDGAILRAPNFFEAAANRANALTSMKKYAEALEAHLHAVEIRPLDPDGWMNRGVALKESGHPEEGLRCLRRALELQPRHVEALYNLGIVLRELRRAHESLAAFDAALHLQPRHALAMNCRGLALRDLGRIDEALASFDKSLAINPRQIEALINRAALLNSTRGGSREALALLERALSIDPNSVEAWVGRGHVLFEINENDRAIACYQEALKRDPACISARIGETVRELRILYEDEADISRRRTAYEEKLNFLEGFLATAGPTDEVLSALAGSQPFYLAYQERNDRALQARYGAMVRRLIQRRYPDVPPPPAPKAGDKIRIGIVSGFFRWHSNWKIPIRGWLEGLDRERFEIFGYHLGRDADAETRRAAALCQRFVQGPMTTDDWRRQIASDRPHVLIYPGLFMDETSLLLAAQRLAPVQCNSWGHPDTSGLPTLDYILSSDLMEPEGATEHYTEQLVKLPGLSIVYPHPEIQPERLLRRDLGLRDDAFVFWSGQTLLKYLPQYDDVFARIAEAAPCVQFIFLKFPRAQEVTEVFRRRLARAFAARGLDPDRHCIFLDSLSPARFLGAMAACDAFLDTIGWSGCNSTLEGLTAPLPIVTLRGRFMRGRHSAAILEALGLKETIANSLDEYVNTSLRLATDSAFFQSRRQLLTDKRSLIYDNNECISALSEFLEAAVSLVFADESKH